MHTEVHMRVLIHKINMFIYFHIHSINIHFSQIEALKLQLERITRKLIKGSK